MHPHQVFLLQNIVLVLFFLIPSFLDLFLFVDIPPDVTIASSIGLNPLIFILKFWSKFTKFFLSCLVIEFTCFSLSIPDNLIIGSISFLGNSSFKLFLNSLFFCVSKSLNIRFSSFSAVSAGFKFMLNSICPLDNSSFYVFVS